MGSDGMSKAGGPAVACEFSQCASYKSLNLPFVCTLTALRKLQGTTAVAEHAEPLAFCRRCRQDEQVREIRFQVAQSGTPQKIAQMKREGEERTRAFDD